MNDKDLGLGRPIDRRDFLDGVALAVGAAALAGCARADAAQWPQDDPAYDPPTLTGLRGSHPGAFENAHALRDGTLTLSGAEDTGETYDLIVVGGGISGLAAAWFWRRAQPDARILVLDNHDDFGGHAKRNEYRLGGKLHLMNGGTMLIDSPRPYGPVPAGLIKALGIDPTGLSKACNRPEIYDGLTGGAWFDRATFGRDALVAGLPGRWGDNSEAERAKSAASFVARTPLPPREQADLLRVYTGRDDYLSGQDDAAKKDRLSRISYGAYLRDLAGCGPQTLAFLQATTHGEWACGIDAVSAIDAWGFGLPGFAGLALTPAPHPCMSFTPRGYIHGGSETFHFPDGNATIARLLVRDLVPGSFGAPDPAAMVIARCRYDRLDRPGNATRIRLSSVAVAVRHREAARAVGPVTVTYVRGGKAYAATARSVVLAGWNAMVPYLVPELPEAQKTALHAAVKSPLVYTTVAVRNWRAFKQLGVRDIYSPGGFHSSTMLNWPLDIGGYRAERDPDRPLLLFMTRTPCKPGLSQDDQARAGRAELLQMPFATFERETRAQLGAMLGSAGFDPARDITGLTVNRWPHGYANEYNYLWEPELPDDQLPHVVGRKRFGRIAIANSDAGGGAYTDVAIEQGYRAVNELLSA